MYLLGDSLTHLEAEILKLYLLSFAIGFDVLRRDWMIFVFQKQ